MRNILLTLFISINVFSYTQVELPQIFSEDMVLKRNKPIPVWGWSDDAGECNLYNNEGFPASPFRTDNWETITMNEKYSFEYISNKN